MNTLTPATRMRGLIATAIIGALTSSFAVVCTAGDKTETFSEVVKYGDLNISDPQGAAMLYRRIAAAARSVCGADEIDSRRLGSRASINACVHQAIVDAVTKVGQPELVAAYNAKNREPLPITLAQAKTH
jgi:UrcA family protein